MKGWLPHPDYTGPKPRALPPLARRMMRSGYPHPQDIAAFRATLPRKLRVTIATPCDDGHKLCYWQSLLAAAQAKLPNAELRLRPEPGDSLIPRGRNRQLHDFYHGTADDYFHPIDSDIDFTVEDLVNTYANPTPIKAGFYAIKQEEVRWCVNTLPGEPVCPKTQLQRLGTAGTGWLCLHRSAVGRMIAAAPLWPHWRIPFTDDNTKELRHLIFAHASVLDKRNFPDHPLGRELSEDWAICYYARELGYDVWGDFRIKVWHEGSVKYPMGTRRLTREEMAAGVIRQPDGSTTPISR